MKKRSFTMTELIICITVIAILVSMLFPALQKARHKAKDLACVNNTRIIHQLCMQYTSDWNGALLKGMFWYNGWKYKARFIMPWDMLYCYYRQTPQDCSVEWFVKQINDNKITNGPGIYKKQEGECYVPKDPFRCTRGMTSSERKKKGVQPNFHSMDYGLNVNVASAFNLQTGFSSPAATILISDMNRSAGNDQAMAFDNTTGGSFGIWYPTAWGFNRDGRHGPAMREINLVMMDGHCQVTNLDQLKNWKKYFGIQSPLAN